jgi:L-amino acid N-acyltransferase YncA
VCKEAIYIRKARAADTEKIVEFQMSTALETEGMQLDEQTVTKGVKAVFEQPSKGFYYIAEKEGQPIGCVLVVPEWSDWRNGTVLWMHSIYVVPQQRRKGVLKELYNYLQEMVLKSPNLMGIRTLIDKRNQRGIKVAQALGLPGDHYNTFEWLKK